MKAQHANDGRDTRERMGGGVMERREDSGRKGERRVEDSEINKICSRDGREVLTSR